MMKTALILFQKMDDEEFLAEASSLLGLEHNLNSLDLKDALRERGFFGDWNDQESMLSFLRAEHYSQKLAEKQQACEEGEIYSQNILKLRVSF